MTVQLQLIANFVRISVINLPLPISGWHRFAAAAVLLERAFLLFLPEWSAVPSAELENQSARWSGFYQHRDFDLFNDTRPEMAFLVFGYHGDHDCSASILFT